MKKKFFKFIIFAFYVSILFSIEQIKDPNILAALRAVQLLKQQLELESERYHKDQYDKYKKTCEQKRIECLDLDQWGELHARFIDAVTKDEPEEVKKFLDSGKIDVNFKLSCGRTALHIASKRGFKKIVLLLLKAGADVNAQDSEDNDPLMYAISGKNPDIANLLISVGKANVNTRNDHGETALMIAAEKDLAGLIEPLLKNGAQINAKDILGETALMKAAKNSSFNSFEILLEKDPNPYLRNRRGQTAFDLVDYKLLLES